MAAGIYDDQSKLVAGLSISAPADRLDEGWLSKLQATAAEISTALGYKTPGAARRVELPPPQKDKAPLGPCFLLER